MTVPSPAAPTRPTNLQTFPAIDMLRGFAALLVLMYHATVYGHWTAVPKGGLWLLWVRGWMGVDLFFVISGFVIAWSALQLHERHERRGAAFRKEFALRRFWRIAPLYFLTCIVYLVLVQPVLLTLPWEKLALHIASHAFFVHNLHPSTHGSINGVSWSVGLEMQFYLVMLFATPWLARTQSIGRSLLALALCALAYRYATTVLWPPLQTPPIEQFIWVSQLPGVIDEFACGIVVALLMHRKNAFVLRHTETGWKNFFAWVLIALPFLLAAIHIDRSYLYWNNVLIIVGYRALLAVCFTALLMAAISFPWAKLPLLWPMRYFGQISYGVYLWHLPVMMTLMTKVPQLRGPEFLTYALVGSVTLASFTWHWLEKPCIERRGLH